MTADAVAGAGTARAGTDEGRRRWTALFSPPGLVFHLVLVPIAASLLWALSGPGVVVGVWLVSSLLLAVAALVWVARAVGCWFLGRNGSTGTDRVWRFAIAPVGCGLVVGLLILNAPLRARWQLSERAFDRAVAHIHDTGDVEAYRDRTVGSYPVIAARTSGRAVVFHDPNGIAADSGFAYLPEGLTPSVRADLFSEGVSVMSLGDDWYVFHAGW